MKKLLVPALLLAACGVEPIKEEHTTVTADDTDKDGEPETPPDAPDVPETPDPNFYAFFISGPNTCEDHSQWFEGRFGYVDGTEIENALCRYEVGGSVVAETCYAEIPLPTAQEVVLIVTDPVTGAVARFEEIVQGPKSFSTDIKVASDGTSITWEAHTDYGGVADVGNVQITITPSENVIIDDPSVLRQLTGTVRVTQPGTYTVRVGASIQFAELGGCGASVEKTIEVTCD